MSKYSEILTDWYVILSSIRDRISHFYFKRNFLFSRFLVSFLVDANGGVFESRQTGIRATIPKGACAMPTLITCRLMRYAYMIFFFFWPSSFLCCNIDLISLSARYNSRRPLCELLGLALSICCSHLIPSLSWYISTTPFKSFAHLVPSTHSYAHLFAVKIVPTKGPGILNWKLVFFFGIYFVMSPS